MLPLPLRGLEASAELTAGEVAMNAPRAGECIGTDAPRAGECIGTAIAGVLMCGT